MFLCLETFFLFKSKIKYFWFKANSFYFYLNLYISAELDQVHLQVEGTPIVYLRKTAAILEMDLVKFCTEVQNLVNL